MKGGKRQTCRRPGRQAGNEGRAERGRHADRKAGLGRLERVKVVDWEGGRGEAMRGKVAKEVVGGGGSVSRACVVMHDGHSRQCACVDCMSEITVVPLCVYACISKYDMSIYMHACPTHYYIHVNA